MAEAAEALELEVGEAAAGGACVARHDGRVVFVRYALPGERVRAVVTEDRGGRFLRADAVDVVRASPARVTPPCPHARPGRCGGCDWQHATAEEQRRIKATVVRDQFARIAGVSVALDSAEPLPGGLLGWRTRINWALAPDGTVGLHRHRSQEIEPVACCPLGVPAVAAAPRLGPESRDDIETIEVVAAADRADETDENDSAAGAPAVLGSVPVRGRRTPHGRGRRRAHRVELLAGPRQVRRAVGEAMWRIDAATFWQVHPSAVATLGDALLAGLRPRPGDRVLDLYAGAGAFTALLAAAVGPDGAVIGVESSATAVADACRNLADVAHAEVRRGAVDAAFLQAAGVDPELVDPDLVDPDLVVLDPPRAGAGAAVMRAILALGPRAVGYVSCDAGTLARDVAVAREQGWALASLRVFDAFPMTAHVECVAILQPETVAAPRES